MFGAAFQQGDVSGLPEPTNPYSEWVLSAFLVGGFMWTVAALTYLLDQGKNPFNVLGDSTLHESYRRAFRILTPLSAAMRIVTICIAISYLLDYQNDGWIVGLALGLHLGCEAIYIPAADAILHAVSATPHQRRVIVTLRVFSFITYAAFVIIAMISAPSQTPRIIFIVFGVLVLIHMFIAELIIQPRHLLADSADITAAGIQK